MGGFLGIFPRNMDSQIEKTWKMSWKLGLCTGPPTQHRPARIGFGSSLHQLGNCLGLCGLGSCTGQYQTSRFIGLSKSWAYNPTYKPLNCLIGVIRKRR